MNVEKKFGPISIDPVTEEACKNRLRNHLVATGQSSIEKNVEELFSLEGGTVERFQYLQSKSPESIKSNLLVSGCAAGSELIIARNKFGFQQIIGTEVNHELFAVARERLSGQPGIRVNFYDGNHVPFPNETFTMVISGHIIEHTPSPYRYLREHMRVLAQGGYLFLEFPGRHHPIELHTNLPSVEHLPWPWRNLVLLYRASSFSRFTPEERFRYRLILNTLQPVSVQIIRKYLKSIDPCSTIIHDYEPVPGFVRLIIHKRAKI